MNTFAITTLGCKVNQYDGQAMCERMTALGWRELGFGETAQVTIVNTCTVTATADEKCRKIVRRAVRANPVGRVIVTGCAATTSPERLRRIKGVTAVLTLEQMVRVGEFLETGIEPASGRALDLGISAFSGHTRAFLKIQDGCASGCSYCIVPLARGPLRSRALHDIEREAERLVDAGHAEVVLTGIHLGHYGRDLGSKPRLCDAVRAVLAARGLQRLRLSSIEAVEVDDKLLDLAASDDRFCPHFHLPLQSGDDHVLAAMRRGYTVSEFLRVIDKVRERFELPALTTDVMVGFPGETEAQFENTLRVCREAGFSRIHIFPFSPRPGTTAVDMPGRVAGDLIRRRGSRLKSLADELALDFKRRLVGRTVVPLVEHRRDRATGLLTGLTERYQKVIFDGPDSLKGKLVPVIVQKLCGHRLHGRVVEGMRATFHHQEHACAPWREGQRRAEAGHEGKTYRIRDNHHE